MLTDEQNCGNMGAVNGLYSAWAASRNINYYLMLVLYTLDGQKSMTQKKICICTGLTKQTVNSVIRSLKEEGYVGLSRLRRRREKQVKLTEKGIGYSADWLLPYGTGSRALTIMGSDRVKQMVDNIALFNTIFGNEMEKENALDKNWKQD